MSGRLAAVAMGILLYLYRTTIAPGAWNVEIRPFGVEFAWACW
jgi:hypothetical protein